jgi:integrase
VSFYAYICSDEQKYYFFTTKTHIMSKVNFNLSPNSDKESNIEFIRLVFRYDTPTKRLVYNVGQGVPRSQWNLKKQRANATRATPQYQELNSNLDKIQKEVLKISTTYQLNGDTLTVDQFKKELDIALGKTERQFKDTSFFAFIEDFIKNRKESLTFAKESIAKYNQVYTHLKNYVKVKRKKVDFENIDLDFFDDFMKYLHSKKYAQNNCQKIITTIKTILNDATERGYNKNYAFKSKKFTISQEDVNNIYLSESELENMYRLDLSNNTRLERVRDLFIIGSYTGLRFSDLSTFNSDNITKRGDNELLMIKTQKTGKDVAIPLHPFVKEILAKYEGTPPRALTNQKMNDYLKEVAQLAELNETVFKSITKGGKRIEVKYEKWELVTTHTARRSFSTNAFKRGIPSISIMRITGHSTEKAFMKYIKIDNEENAILMYESDFFKGISEPHPLKKVS